MFVLSVERTFSAAHQVRVAGEMEPLHGHDWRVRACVEGDSLDANGLLCDFQVVERAVDEAIAPWKGRTLNGTSPFSEAHLPTAEHVALAIARALAPRVPAPARLARVSVTEAPGCEATFVVDAGQHAPGGAR
ncbi:MAG: 6-carboxytetrahydropterin synthase [Planctomycetota bacterium]|nr:6-carboxytetrahydropterin synthase [Planctomycetota bacterium]MDA1105611.1 6-carboxytetrahydropterin synthase [Planctomycetota bacterium]